MKFKYVLPIVAAGLFVACSDDNPSDPFVPGVSSASEVPVDPLNPQVTSSASEVPVVPPTDITSSASEVPVDPPTDITSSASDVPVVPPEVSSSSVVVPPVEEGKLAALDPNKSYTFYGAELTGTDLLHYGRYEARMKMAAISGTVSSMFLNYDYSWKKGVEPWNEIDIEVLGKDPSKWQSNLITREPDGDDGKKNKNITSEKIHEYGFDATAEFHLYTIVWTPEYISWEIDSVEVRRDVVGNPNGLAHDQVAFMTEQQSLRFNLWASNSAGWTGKFTGIGLPIEQQIDYVRVYSYDEATKGFTLLWQDDFEGTALDSKHWTRGDWEMEKVMLRPQNVKVGNGVARLILDYEEG